MALLLTSLTSSNSYLKRLHTESPAEALRIERVLATARAFLAMTSLVAIWIDSTDPSRYTRIADGLMAGYAFYSLLVLAWLRVGRRPSDRLRLLIHSVDVIWPAVIALFTAGPSSPFFLFNIFVLLEAAYRWGFSQTLATAGAEVVLFFGGALLTNFTAGGVNLFASPAIELNRFIMRGLYLLIMGYLLGYLGYQEKIRRSELARIAQMLVKVQSETGLKGALQEVLNDACYLFGSDRALVVLREISSDRFHLWEGRLDTTTRELSINSAELDYDQRTEYQFECPARTWFASRRESGGNESALKTKAVDHENSSLKVSAWTPPKSFLKSKEFKSLFGSEFEFKSDWSGTLLLLDPDTGSDPEMALNFLQVITQQISPAIYHIFVMRRLRSRTSAVERARVARELHDGVIQALIGLEMQLDVLRRTSVTAGSKMGEELGRIQGLLRQEVLNLRDLMQHMKPIDLGPRQFLDFVAYTVDKFRHDTGISAEFLCSFQEVSLAPRIRTEMARIVQEALMNVRKHSKAGHVVVRFESNDGNWKLSIDDDGRGFDFSGRLTQNELDSARKGPLVIKERVRALGGQMVVESNPGHGARLEISVPQKNNG